MGIVQLRDAEAHLREQALPVQAQVAGDFQVVGENGGAGEGGHLVVFPELSIGVPLRWRVLNL
ncbi:hypothetical protein D3C81_1536080 [compost metagenome]